MIIKWETLRDNQIIHEHWTIIWKRKVTINYTTFCFDILLTFVFFDIIYTKEIIQSSTFKIPSPSELQQSGIPWGQLWPPLLVENLVNLKEGVPCSARRLWLFSGNFLEEIENITRFPKNFWRWVKIVVIILIKCCTEKKT